MSSKKKKKLRVSFQKNRQNRSRKNDLTRDIETDSEGAEDAHFTERLSGKGDLTRFRTIVSDADDGSSARQVDESRCLRGRVIQYVGSLDCRVSTEDGKTRRCTVRQVVRKLSRDQRNAIVAGDFVWILPLSEETGVVERIDQRGSTLSRFHDRKEHVIAANVDQAVIVASLAQPALKPGLIDRFIVSALKGAALPIICINKIDLRSEADEKGDFETLIESYRQLGYPVVLCSATDGSGIDELRGVLTGKLTVFAGQSGVGKSSLLNVVQPGLGRLTGDVSDESGKGRHTTRVAELIPLDGGGWVVDTPGIRQFQLWDVGAGELEAYFVEFLPYIPMCKFPNCTHIHETGCSVKQAVAEGAISTHRYESYVRILMDG